MKIAVSGEEDRVSFGLYPGIVLLVLLWSTAMEGTVHADALPPIEVMSGRYTSK